MTSDTTDTPQTVDAPPPADAPTALEFAEAARKLASEKDLETALSSVVKLAVDLGACEFACVTLRRGKDRFETAAPTDERVIQADLLQYEYNQGPCIDALWTNGVYAANDLAHDDRWPQWGPEVAKLGLNSILSVHLFTDRLALGAINMYSATPRTYAVEDLEVARIIAAHASVALARIRVETDLWGAIDSRHLVGQAQGMLIERFNLTSEQAFALLKRYSQQYNIKLNEVASHLVRTRELPGQAIDS